MANCLSSLLESSEEMLGNCSRVYKYLEENKELRNGQQRYVKNESCLNNQISAFENMQDFLNR